MDPEEVIEIAWEVQREERSGTSRQNSFEMELHLRRCFWVAEGSWIMFWQDAGLHDHESVEIADSSFENLGVKKQPSFE